MADRHTNDDNDRNVPDENPRIAPLSDVKDFQVADGYPDPRGWDVMAADGRKVGTVHDLIVDTGQLRTRYLDVALDKDAIGSRDDRDVLIPVGAAQLDDSADHVVLGSFTTAQLTAIPEFRHEAITRDYENSVLDHMPGRGGRAGATAATTGAMNAAPVAPPTAPGYYDTEHFDDTRFYGTRGTRANTDRNAGTMSARTGATADRDVNASRNENEARVTRSEEELDVEKRRVQAGEVDVHKHVDTEHVSTPVTLRHEEVTIERRPLRADQTADTRNIGEDNEIRIPLTEEQAVVEKRLVPKEELVIKKHMVTEEKTVEADVRKERVDIDRSHEHDASRDENDRPERR